MFTIPTSQDFYELSTLESTRRPPFIKFRGPQRIWILPAAPERLATVPAVIPVEISVVVFCFAAPETVRRILVITIAASPWYTASCNQYHSLSGNHWVWKPGFSSRSAWNDVTRLIGTELAPSIVPGPEPAAVSRSSRTRGLTFLWCAYYQGRISPCYCTCYQK